MKIGIMGAHGTGKTTFAREITERIKGELGVAEVTVIGGIARRCPWPINQDATEQAQRWIWLTHYMTELEASDKGDVIICDRTLLDSLAYATVAGYEDVVDDYFFPTLRWMETYDTVYWMRPVEGRLVGDGQRDTDPEYQTKVDQVFEGWVSAFKHYIKVTEINER